MKNAGLLWTRLEAPQRLVFGWTPGLQMTAGNRFEKQIIVLAACYVHRQWVHIASAERTIQDIQG